MELEIYLFVIYWQWLYNVVWINEMFFDWLEYKVLLRLYVLEVWLQENDMYVWVWLMMQ